MLVKPCLYDACCVPPFESIVISDVGKTVLPMMEIHWSFESIVISDVGKTEVNINEKKY